MTDYEGNYKALNANQRQAVDTLDGPVLVVAGPGTGKTQLLAMRAAKILQATDTLPGNILCLTFTDAAASEMRQRLIKLIGPEGNRVAVHTFHSFGSEIINNHPEYFYSGARFKPADKLTGYELLNAIFEELPHSNPLSQTMNGRFTALGDAQAAISHLKRAGILPGELKALLSHNEAFFKQAEPLLDEVFAERLSKKSFGAVAKLATKLGDLERGPALERYKPVGDLFVLSLQLALGQAEASGKTTSLTAWRNQNCEKNHLGRYVIKDRSRAKRLRALANIYQRYAEVLKERELFDFDDMVCTVAKTMEDTPELRFNLQEQYLYVMVDEFQDTNGAQLRLLSALADNPVNEGRPNILAVGDDDQAIYSFQGAELSNIIDFKARYPSAEVIVLTDNYRSTAPILEQSRAVVTQADQRLETELVNIRKQLTAHSRHTQTDTSLHNFTTIEAELRWVADEVKRLVKQGTAPSEIAIIGRRHQHLVQFLPYLHAAGLPVNYERRQNVLETAHIQQLVTLARTVVYLGEGRHSEVEALLPELLSYDFWGLDAKELWTLSLKAYAERRMWLGLMLEADGPLHAIAEFLLTTAKQAFNESAEAILDRLIGSNEAQVPSDDQTDNGLHQPAVKEDSFISPYRAFYFNAERLKTNPGEYLELLSNLGALRREIGKYRPGHSLSLADFVDFVDLCELTSTRIIDNAETQEASQAVNLMTAHGAKGREFDAVFVLSCQDDIWGRSARRPASSLHFPLNLPIEPAGRHYDDALRLFFVAMTRARHTLLLTNHLQDGNGKATVLAEFLQAADLASQQHDGEAAPANQLSLSWQQRYLNLPGAKQRQLLEPLLDVYRLSATHLNNFVDVTRGGPQAFLLQNLLRFPQAMTPAQAFGQAVHTVLARAHTHLSASGEPRPIEDIMHDFELQLQNARLAEADMGYWLDRGSDVLQTFLAARYGSFDPKQKAEYNFSGQESKLGEVRLSGAIDLMTINEKAKTIVITDYKTGKAFSSWAGRSDYDKIKLHKYRQQLMFYKFLVENSRDFAGYTVTRGELEFVEADPNGQLQRLGLEFDSDELAAFEALVKSVWSHIQTLHLPSIDDYPPTYKGLLEFEKSLE